MPGRPPPDQGLPAVSPTVPFTWDERPVAARIPEPLTTFIGREREIDAVSAMLHRPEVRLLTLTGPGGIGKTRLALRIGGISRTRYDDGVAFVALAPVRDPDRVLSTIVYALDVPDLAGQPLTVRLQAFLAPRHLLLVLDNLEHLIEAAPVVATLLATNPRLTVLCTSRTRLGISGEHVFTVPPLAVPDVDDAHRPDRLHESEAVRLFVQRAEAHSPGFALTWEDGPVVASICRRLDGLPLAIELAAARTMVLPPPALLARLEHRLDLLTSGPRDAPERLRDMRGAIAWSHDLLTEPERVLFRRLGVFSGGFTIEAVQAVAGGEADVLEGISALVAASLVNPLGTVAGEPRLTLLETIREYALERLSASGEEDAVRDAHAAWCVELAEAAMPYWSTPDQTRWADRCEAEHDNLRAALAWLAGTSRIPDAVRMIGTVWFFWFVHTHWTDGGSWLEWALTWTDGERTLQRVRVLNGAAALALSTGDAERSLALGAESLALGRDIDSLCQVTVIDSPLFGLAAAASVVGDYDRAIEFNEAALALCRSLAGVVPSAIPTESVVLTNMAHVARALNDEPRAIRLAEEALALQEEVGFTWGAVDSLWFLATVAEREDDTARAVILFCKSLSLAAECRDGQQVVVACERIALIAAQARRHEQAVRLMGAAERLREWLGNNAEPLVQERWNQAAATARTRLGEMAFAAAWSAGRALSLEDAVTEARRIEAPTAPPSDNGPDRMGLTRREYQVLQLLAEGRSNRAIADVLSLSERTVENHVLHVLTKLNLESRTAAAAFAVRHGLD